MESRENMCEKIYNLPFEKLSISLGLGTMIDEPKSIAGGLLHRMYKIITTKGVYAVKALNPVIMSRPNILQSYIITDTISNIASKYVPALSAKMINGESIHCMDDQYFMIFDWLDGASLRTEEIMIEHSNKIAVILADIHRINFQDQIELPKEENQGTLIEWNIYIKEMDDSCNQLIHSLEEYKQDLYSWDEKAIFALEELQDNKVVSHRDLDSKNVMWSNEAPILIDWESAGFIHPLQDLIETALYWSDKEDGTTDKERFLSFIDTYKEKQGEIRTNWRTILEVGYRGKLEWLEYNIKRALGIECSDEKEQLLGEEQVELTLLALKKYEEKIDRIEEWLNSSVTVL